MSLRVHTFLMHSQGEHDLFVGYVSLLMADGPTMDTIQKPVHLMLG